MTVLILHPTGGRSEDGCRYNWKGEYECHISGEDRRPVDPPPRNPIRYLWTTTLDGVDCYYWSRRPGGVDTWDPANDPTTIAIIATLPECDWPDPEIRAWEVFRRFPLAPPDPALQPPGAGIAHLPTYLSLPSLPAPITHREALPDGRSLQVDAAIVALQVDWGDGTTATYDPDDAVPYPDGTVTHPYVYRTCPAEERATTGGGPCHPSLDAYTITVTFLWEGRWRTTGPWQPLDTVARTTALRYPVDEIQGVLVTP